MSRSSVAARSSRFQVRSAWPSIGGPVLTSAVLFALYLWTLAPSISELHDNLDSAELVTVASVGGIAHPPGSALWLPLAWAALKVFTFLDEPAARTNLLSAICMAAAGGVLAAATVRWRPETPGWAGAFAGLLAGLAPITWAQGLVTEVLALQALLTAVALWLAPAAAEGKRWPAFALVLGLLAWNHPTGLALVPLAAVAASRRLPPRRDRLPALALFLLPGVLTVAYLWLRADAEIAWGQTDSLRGIWEHLSGSAYQGAVDLGTAPQSLPETLRRLLRQLPPPAWLLVAIGALALSDARPRLAVALVATCVLLIGFVSAYRATGRQDYLAPVIFIAAMAAAYGAEEAWDWLRRRLRTRQVVLAAAVGLWGLVGVWGVIVGDDVSRRGDTTLRDIAVARLEAAPDGALIETSDDADTFGLWYAQVVLGVRPDVTIVDVRGAAPVIGPGAR
ncbi:MAG: DUF2723 domain-containing protein [Dehalococcoidia bacterium]|nr:DUF2723 domain-containing protein [Dehalococcoidia bacterium]MCB9491836.1 DUF2723 domain-containing protein [Dehalococcoidia bacterium]